MPNKTVNEAVERRIYNKGSKINSIEYDIDDDIQTGIFTIDRVPLQSLPKKLACLIRGEEFIDGQWLPSGGVDVEGGEYRDKGGNITTFTDVTFNFRPGVNRKLRINIECLERFEVNFKFDLDVEDRLIKFKQQIADQLNGG